MTLISAILGIVSSIMPFIIKALGEKTAPKRLPKSRVKKLKEFRDENRIEITWAEHDADLEQLLDTMPIFSPKAPDGRID